MRKKTMRGDTVMNLLQRSRVPWRVFTDDEIEQIAIEAANAGDETLRVRALRALARR